VVVVLVEPRNVWWLYWLNPGLCGGCTGCTQECVVVVLVEPRNVWWFEYISSFVREKLFIFG